MRHRTDRLGAAVAAAVLASSLPALAKPPKDAKDHPMMSRYEGSEILFYEHEKFDERHLLVKKATEFGGIENNLDSAVTLEGETTRIIYEAPPERGTLEVFRNYEQELRKHGFEDLFRCTNNACGVSQGKEFNHAVGPFNLIGGTTKDQRYLAAKLSRAQGDVYVGLYVVDYRGRGRVRVLVDVVEATPMEAGKVTIDAAALAREIDAEGHVAIYSIYFETDSAKLKPESDPTLAVIAQMLDAQPELQVFVVGHTDNQGTLRHNLDLSTRRSQAVVNALVSRHGISEKRLTAHGVGFLAPVASNKSEAGRAKNRRVELVHD